MEELFEYINFSVDSSCLKSVEDDILAKQNVGDGVPQRVPCFEA